MGGMRRKMRTHEVIPNSKLGKETWEVFGAINGDFR